MVRRLTADLDRRRARAAADGAVTALAWLYLYSVVWLAVYLVLSALVLGWTPTLVTGGSMQPHIVAGDLVMVAPSDQVLGPGTVVTFRQPGVGRLVTHRVVDVVGDAYLTQGDANAQPDSDVVPRSEVLGAGRLLVPVLGRPLMWGRDRDVLPLALWAEWTSIALVLVSRRRSETPEEDTQVVGRPRRLRVRTPVLARG